MVQGNAENPLPVHNFGLNELNVQLDGPPPEAGENAPLGPDAQPDDADAENPDERISAIWNQLFVDIFQVSPNPRGRTHNSKYTTLSTDEIQAVTEATFLQPVLPFRQAAIKRVEPRTWDTTFFDRFFPLEILTAEVEGRPTQNFSSCAYFQLWQALRASVDDATAAIVRERLLTRWRTLHWLPYSGSDRMWATSRFKSGHYIVLPPGYVGACPQIAVNARCPHALADFTIPTDE